MTSSARADFGATLMARSIPCPASATPWLNTLLVVGASSVHGTVYVVVLTDFSQVPVSGHSNVPATTQPKGT